jgi:uncharacterized protein
MEHHLRDRSFGVCDRPRIGELCCRSARGGWSGAQLRPRSEARFAVQLSALLSINAPAGRSVWQATGMRHYLLFYTYSSDYLERRPQYRDAHLTHALSARQRGALLLGGALSPPDTGVLLFDVNSPGELEEFARNDPYVIHGLVTAWTVREWTTVVGDSAKSPLFPAGTGSPR